ncbi:type I 3-dehydroquinate dehydratase [Virgibacillus dakarensis]|uniref:3-dehydroquinate dehydratase n=1 Tax=Lentibacillus populi TaxID=1827502 RepID=A0A9W5TYX7_9BACI|nr:MULTISPECIES: type I 3-dehydroquinate dehydratase [Bacillaceae]MBT2216393.1 type I 3-dehydroquinate dehydratase [Virgibacillus dakarensis]MTW86583.1 type I 3-dehydroquinate dehydratase [Virgibacillus dakarensis]GGB47167.1 3-dehydroquinate dehydratase [Lentibacillus populi]
MKLFQNKKIPYICTPLTGKNKEEITEELRIILPKKPDLVEWRADFLEGIEDEEYVLSIADIISTASDIPILITIRSEKEGGEKIPLTEEEKVNLLSKICKSTMAEMVDFEASNAPDHIMQLRKLSTEYNKQLILSYHNFDRTPSNREMMEHMSRTASFGADVAKIAVMPKSKEDVLRLLEFTKQADDALDIPIVSMSMGKMGSLSRIMGWAYGSVITFSVGKESSAPGQVPIEKLRSLIRSTQEIVGEWG